MAYIITIGIGIGSVKTHLKYLAEKIDKLERKQDKYNNMQERMILVEQSTKSAHHRIDDLKDRGDG
jgi:cell division protein FtsL